MFIIIENQLRLNEKGKRGQAGQETTVIYLTEAVVVFSRGCTSIGEDCFSSNCKIKIRTIAGKCKPVLWKIEIF